MPIRWKCISQQPLQWASKIGRVIREPDGRWRWCTAENNGVEPSRVEAINQVMREFRGNNIGIVNDCATCPRQNCNEVYHRDGRCRPSKEILTDPTCDTCKYESPEERYTDTDWWWEYHCNLADHRKIERKDGELHPDWCPLIGGNIKAGIPAEGVE